MNNIKLFLTPAVFKWVVLFLPMILSLQASAEQASAEVTNSPGVYFKSAKGFIALPALENMDGLGYDYSRHVLNLPVIETGDLTLTVIVNAEAFSPEAAEFELRTLESPGVGVEMVPATSEKLAENKYQLTFKIKDRSQHFLLIDTGCCRREQVYGVVLTDPRAALARIFADKGQNPVSAEYVLAGILRGAPHDKQIKSLHQQWQARVEQQQASELFGYVEKAWAEYEKASDTAAKVDALRRVEGLSQRYLTEHNKGSDTAAVKKYLKSAQDKLDI